MAGAKVWANGQPSVIKSPTFPVSANTPVALLPSGDIFPAWTVTHAACGDAQRVVELVRRFFVG